MITRRPVAASIEGINIRTWTGFKHFEYAVNEAIVSLIGVEGTSRWLREGHSYDITATRVSLTNVIELGHALTVSLEPLFWTSDERLILQAEIHNDSLDKKSLKGVYTVSFNLPSDQLLTLKANLSAPQGEVPPSKSPRPVRRDGHWDSPTFYHEWTIPYYYCANSDRLSYMGVVRSVETVVDEYLADVGMFIPRVLKERHWIPVVTRYSTQVQHFPPMGALCRTYFRVTNIVADIAFDGEWALECYDETLGIWTLAATGEIRHGYAISEGPEAGSVASLDDDTISLLTRRK